jgi:hypothetical protein
LYRYSVAPGHSAGDLNRPHGTVSAPTLLKMYPRSGPHEGVGLHSLPGGVRLVTDFMS